jgi:hypothetical protein
MNQAFLSGLKEFLRTELLAVLPIVIAALQRGSINWEVVGTLSLVAILKGLDDWLSKNDQGINKQGITGF